MTIAILIALVLLAVWLWPRKKQDYFDRTTMRMGVRCSKCGTVSVQGDRYAESICPECIQSI